MRIRVIREHIKDPDLIVEVTSLVQYKVTHLMWLDKSHKIDVTPQYFDSIEDVLAYLKSCGETYRIEEE